MGVGGDGGNYIRGYESWLRGRVRVRRRGSCTRRIPRPRVGRSRHARARVRVRVGVDGMVEVNRTN